MSTRYKSEIVDSAEDGALRAILRNTFMPGNISLSFQREPNFFTAEQAGNLESQVIAIRENNTGTIVGFGCRSFRKSFIDGQVTMIGYLSGLRGLPEVRGGMLLARAYRYLKQLHGDGKVPYYLTTILDDNQYAKTLLTSQRVGLPTYYPLGRISTFLLPLYGKKGKSHEAVVKGQKDLLPEAVEFINLFNSQRQFSPFYSVSDLQGDTTLLPCFDSHNLYVYKSGSKITAAIGIWDQNSFKQSVVAGYKLPYRLIKPLSNLGSALGVSAKLPEIGKHFPYLYASFASHATGHDDDLIALISHVQAEWSRRGFAYLLVGVHERDPLFIQLQQMSAMAISSTVYIVYWEDSLNQVLPSGIRMPHLEVATL